MFQDQLGLLVTRTGCGTMGQEICNGQDQVTDKTNNDDWQSKASQPAVTKDHQFTKKSAHKLHDQSAKHNGPPDFFRQATKPIPQ